MEDSRHTAVYPGDNVNLLVDSHSPDKHHGVTGLENRPASPRKPSPYVVFGWVGGVTAFAGLMTPLISELFPGPHPEWILDVLLGGLFGGFLIISITLTIYRRANPGAVADIPPSTRVFIRIVGIAIPIGLILLGIGGLLLAWPLATKNGSSQWWTLTIFFAALIPFGILEGVLLYLGRFAHPKTPSPQADP